MMKLLRKLGGNINARDGAGRSMLHGVAHTDTPLDLKIARMLISWEGFDLNAKDWKGFTALDLAKVKGNPKMAKLLLKLGVSSNVDLSEQIPRLTEND